MKEVFIGSSIALIIFLGIGGYATERLLSPDQSQPIVPGLRLE